VALLQWVPLKMKEVVLTMSVPNTKSPSNPQQFGQKIMIFSVVDVQLRQLKLYYSKLINLIPISKKIATLFWAQALRPYI
jgi:hypothetical protein